MKSEKEILYTLNLLRRSLEHAQQKINNAVSNNTDIIDLHRTKLSLRSSIAMLEWVLGI